MAIYVCDKSTMLIYRADYYYEDSTTIQYKTIPCSLCQSICYPFKADEKMRQTKIKS